MSHFKFPKTWMSHFQVSQDLDESFQVSQDLDEVWTARFVRPARLQWEGLVNDNSVGCAWQCVPGLMHVIDSTAQQNSCLTRAEYLARVVSRRVPHAPPVRFFNYSILQLVVVLLTFAMVSCGLLKTR